MPVFGLMNMNIQNALRILKSVIGKVSLISAILIFSRKKSVFGLPSIIYLATINFINNA